MRGLWVIIGVNVLAVTTIGALAYGFGGGFTSGTFQPDTPVVVMRLVPVETLPARPRHIDHSAAIRPGPEVPAEDRAVEPAIERWETGTDGRLRLRD